MKKTYLLAIVLFAVFAMCGCNRVEVIDVQGEVIAVKKVNKEAGFFSLPITSPNNSKLVWRARPISNWLHVNDEGWKQNAYNLFVNYDSNESSIYVRNFARVLSGSMPEMEAVITKVKGDTYQIKGFVGFWPERFFRKMEDLK